ncbi:MAG TPA: alpha-L-fucosidase [Bacteroidales bacterium]|nr:MAG: Alpha-L-fucosidase [Bacteroidetes bacterium ADurb.Bin139]HOG25726.1 alpha-L-fucosidase [Bacteroidales bacterium]HOR10918.1 alpha-L-fucosidase [Bacteroidales bacterium]HOZ19321.1 alpha-L-fucosidase [Bacteroidales bacterium]HPK38391.1 alpha-L-fucosidase [Bacteroidales bacterium]
MENKIVFRILFVFFAIFLSRCKQFDPPAPYGPVPGVEQLEWQKMEYYMFVHFGPNTFTGVEWGSGKEDPAVFNPTALDCRQWAQTAKNAGMQGIIITAKHHDGFCLWPSRYSTHSVRYSPWLSGQGDVLAELSAACREYGLKFGVYLSPWDRNNPAYGTPEYNQLFVNTLAEVLASYGPVFEQWFDGACGDLVSSPYDWNLFNSTVLEYQPNAVIFSDVGPGCRWVGNERGFAGETNWSTLDTAGFTPGRNAPPVGILNSGQRGAPCWIPAEADVSLRPGWFYSPGTDNALKSVEELMDIYFASVGRNANLLLNVSPDRRGLIPEGDSLRLMEFRQRRDEVFSRNLARGARVIASSVRNEDSRKFCPENVTDSEYDTYWTLEEGKTTASLIIDLDREENFSVLMLQEYIPLGQRIARFIVEYWHLGEKQWRLLAGGTTIGYKRLLRFPAVTSDKIRISILEADAPPLINTIGIF